MKSLQQFEKEWKQMDTSVKSLVVSYGEVLGEAYGVTKNGKDTHIRIYQEWGTGQFVHVATCRLQKIIAINGFLGSCDVELKKHQVKGYIRKKTTKG